MRPGSCPGRSFGFRWAARYWRRPKFDSRGGRRGSCRDGLACSRLGTPPTQSFGGQTIIVGAPVAKPLCAGRLVFYLKLAWAMLANSRAIAANFWRCWLALERVGPSLANAGDFGRRAGSNLPQSKFVCVSGPDEDVNPRACESEARTCKSGPEEQLPAASSVKFGLSPMTAEVDRPANKMVVTLCSNVRPRSSCETRSNASLKFHRGRQVRPGNFQDPLRVSVFPP